MSYQAIYRKYRPKNFKDVVGQDHVVKILKNQIGNKNIAHAYLFCGTRGTGKTSMAKIFARAINCLNPEDGNPCNECEVCKGIINQEIMDVVEMDAASNNSVEDIRDLRERVKYLPSKGRYKVYIIDEVHMLSKGAFNAFLKTLEEPPEHLVFILATTEPEKIPATILSRCQRYDLKRIGNDDLVENMTKISKDLEIEIDEKALRLIAQNADGAMRDALSILDQCIAFANTGETISYEYITEILGIVNTDILFELVDEMIKTDLVKTLDKVNFVVQNGKDVHQFIRDIIMHFRNLMMVKLESDLKQSIDASEITIAHYLEQANKLKLEQVTSIIQELSRIESAAKFASQPRVILETGLIQIIERELKDYTDLKTRLDELESKLQSGQFQTTNSNTQSIDQKTSLRNTQTRKAMPAKKTQIKANESKEMTVFKGEREDVSLEEVKSDWTEILQKIRKDNVSLFAYLREGYPADINGNMLIIAFAEAYGFHRSAVDREKPRQYINNVINLHLKANFSIQFVMEDQLNIVTEETKDDVMDKARELFGQELVEEID